jgi:tetratricopeptide (TPR) repeat protein
MRLIALLIAFGAILAIGGSLASWPAAGSPAASDDIAICASGATDVKIAACTRLIQSGHRKGRDLAAVYGERGAASYRRGDYNHAIADLTEAIRLNPKLAAAYDNRGGAYDAIGDQPHALADFDRAILLSPNFGAAYRHRGLVYYAQAELDRAHADFDQAIRLSPDDWQSYVRRGDISRMNGVKDRGLADYQAALSMIPAGETRRQEVTDKIAALQGAPDASPAQASAPAQEAAVAPPTPEDEDAKVCAASGADDEKIAACTRSIESKRLEGADLAEILSNRGLAYLKKGDYDRSIADLDEAIRLAPDAAEARRARSVVYFLKQDYGWVIADANEALKLHPDDATFLVMRGFSFGRNRDYRHAIDDCTEAAKLSPMMGDAFECRGYAYNGEGEYAQAIADLDKALSLSTDSLGKLWSLKDRGGSYLGKKDYDRAIKDFDQAIEVKLDASAPEPAAHLARSEAFAGRGDAYRGKGENQKAQADYQAAVALIAPNDPLSKEIAGKIAALQTGASAPVAPSGGPPAPEPKVASKTTLPAPVGDDDDKTCRSGDSDVGKAIAACTRLIESQRLHGHELAQILISRSAYHIAKLDYDHVVADLDEAARIEPKDFELRRMRGNIHLFLSAYGQAVADFTEALALEPDALAPDNSDPSRRDIIVFRGLARARNHDNDGAIADCGAAAKLWPDHTSAIACLGYAYVEKGDYDRAIEYLDRALALSPNDPSSLKDRGRSYVAKKDYDRAIQDFDKALGLAVDMPMPLFRLMHGEVFVGRADAFKAKGESQKALADYQAALPLIPVGEPLGKEVAAKIAALQAPPKPVAEQPAAPAYAGRRVALVIGNRDYPNAALANPLYDADLVTAALKKIGFVVTEVKNADFKAMDAALTDFVAKEDRPDVVLFYFAGHGFAINDGTRQHNYLMSTSADLGATSPAMLRREGMPLDEMIERISAPAKITLAFVDACRNDPFHRGAGDRGFERIGIQLHRQLFIGMSTELGKTAIDGVEGKGSPFAQAFAQIIATPGLRVDDAFRELREEVSRTTDDQQKPEILQDDLQRGAFVLANPQ